MFKKGDKVTIKQGAGRFPLTGFKSGTEYIVKNGEYYGHSVSDKSAKEYCVEILNEDEKAGYAPEEWLKLVNDLKDESEEI